MACFHLFFFVGENSFKLENNHSQEFNHINLNEPPFESKIIFPKSHFFKVMCELFGSKYLDYFDFQSNDF